MVFAAWEKTMRQSMSVASAKGGPPGKVHRVMMRNLILIYELLVGSDNPEFMRSLLRGHVLCYSTPGTPLAVEILDEEQGAVS